MENTVRTQVKAILAEFIDITPEELSMEADLDLDYDIDSTELTELARKISEAFAVTVSRSSREAWTSGNAVASFVVASLGLEHREETTLRAAANG